MSCANTESNYKLLSVDQIAILYPGAISSALASLNVKGCRLSPKSYCTQDKCHFSGTPPNSIPLACSCKMFTIFANMYLGMYQTIYCILTNQSTDTYELIDQSIVINIVDTDGGSIENVNATIDQNLSVEVTNITSSTIKESIAGLSYDSIQNILNQAYQNPSYFKDAVSQQILEAFSLYGRENLNQSVTVNVTSTIQSLTMQNESIIINIDNSTWNSLKINLTQSALIEVLAKNITTISLDSVLQNALTQSIGKIENTISKKYCYIPSKNYYYFLFIFLVLVPIYVFVEMYKRSKTSQVNITNNIYERLPPTT